MGIETELDMVERHICRGEIIIAKQKAIIQRLTKVGRSTALAEDVLLTFQQIQASHVAHRARLFGLINRVP